MSPLANRVIKSNKDVVKDLALGKVENCGSYYPVTCLEGIVDYDHCARLVSAVLCYEDYGSLRSIIV